MSCSTPSATADLLDNNFRQPEVNKLATVFFLGQEICVPSEGSPGRKLFYFSIGTDSLARPSSSDFIVWFFNGPLDCAPSDTGGYVLASTGFVGKDGKKHPNGPDTVQTPAEALHKHMIEQEQLGSAPANLERMKVWQSGLIGKHEERRTADPDEADAEDDGTEGSSPIEEISKTETSLQQLSVG